MTQNRGDRNRASVVTTRLQNGLLGNAERWKLLMLRAAAERAMGKARTSRRWSGEVTAHSDALDLWPHIVEPDDPRVIARSSKRSAEASHRRKAVPFRHVDARAFYINRAGAVPSAASPARGCSA